MKHDESYIFVFTSNYHGYYIEELLRRNNIQCTFRKAPRAIGKSCNTALYVHEKDVENANKLIKQTKIPYQGLYKVIRKDGNPPEYSKVKL
jgi:predicted hydrocarbon binding protein